MTDLAHVGRAFADRYLVEREIGRGGMAVVYLAREFRHKRRVALKVLLPQLAESLGAERFLREIEIAAKLNHPRIIPLLDSGVANDMLYYAMPFVDGESLRTRIEREKQLPVNDAIEITRQVAAALSYAHGQGVVHRDVKPENVMLSGDEALVADFGIARAVEAAGGARLTATGIAVGTPLYMSPEQASGAADVDARSDVYALACVLHEMLAGEPPFTGPTAQAIMARKLSLTPPDLSMLRDSVPAAVGEVVSKALKRLPADRYATAAQFSDALRLATERPLLRPHEPTRRASRWRERVLWLAAGAVAASLVLFAATRQRQRASDATEIVRLSQSLPPSVKAIRGPGYASSVALSPNGRMLVVAGIGPDGQRLYQRTVDKLDVTPLAGTEGGSSPFFSPDGQWIGFFAEGRLRRVPAAGGTAVDITNVAGYPGGAHWGANERIVFASGARAPIYIVNARGGDAEPISKLEPNELGHLNPELLPNGRTLLFESGGSVHALDIESGRRTVLAAGASPRYVDGYVIMGRGTALLGAPFDPARLELEGPVVPLVEGVAREGTQLSHYAVSSSGSLAYLPGPSTHELVLADATGQQQLVTDDRLVFENPQFSPDGRRIAVATGRRLGEPTDIWIYDLVSKTSSRLTFEGGRAPVWTLDGTSVTFSKPGEQRGIYTKATDGRGDAQKLLALDEFHWLIGWTSQGTLAYGALERSSPGGASSSSLMAVDGSEPRRVLGPGSLWGGRLSPNGRWLAYYVLESGRFDVYVTPFPGAKARWLISDQSDGEGGRDPTWGPDGREIYYRSGDRLVSARIDTSAGVHVVRRRVVLAPFSPPLYDDYDVHPDGRTLVFVRPEAASDRDVVLVLNWLADVRRATGR